ncbi:MAG: DUF1211 domain-containing protein [Candidatus Latescibacteria bacterium]|nr:DUF1211 domain-containing protein [bacterium]MBD3424931.1 DUF1211 domain-containing protein [Candidatus Latescibacterota bacterium]
MSWSEDKLRELPVSNNFRMRGMEMTRLETFIDAAFAFSVTLLVISIDSIPGNYREFIDALKGIPTFAASFFIISTFWLGHRKWSRRYGLTDRFSAALSLCLMFVILVYIYPLKLMFSVLFAWITGGWLPSEFALEELNQLLGLFVIYGIGLTALASLMGLLYVNALKSSDGLNLSRVEKILTREEIAGYLVTAATGLISVGMAILLPDRIAVLSAFIYGTLPVTIPLATSIFSRKARKIAAGD